ncbi:MAG: hypothetical protein ICV60_17275 [Pyrinomonadaceae bacterium]|nr:hypothetical protein [Pyrinomonadaceae bacterium]
MRTPASYIFIFVLSALTAFSSLSLPQALAEQEQAINPALARKYFVEAETICRRDDGRLWGRTLCGPLMFVDSETRTAVANQADKEGRLVQKDGLFAGKLPDEVGAANTALNWAGVRWTMIMWPLPSNKYARARLMLHEMFHRVQDELGLPAGNPSNNHLDSMEGRLWLQAEWLALREAVTHPGAARKESIADALLFRSLRRQVFSQAATEERALEMNEGLAEYTGVRLSGRTDEELYGYLAAQLDQAAYSNSFVRSFAYTSGPAYGFLLDQSNTNWRKGLKATDDLGLLLERAYSIKLPENFKREAEARLEVYGGEEVRLSETAREARRQKTLARFRAKLIDGPVLVIPVTAAFNYTFNPNNLASLDGVGTIYPTLRAMDAWGILNVTDGSLMTRGAQGQATRVYVTAPVETKGSSIKGDGWTLELNAGWTVEPGERKGDYVLKRRD